MRSQLCRREQNARPGVGRAGGIERSGATDVSVVHDTAEVASAHRASTPRRPASPTAQPTSIDVALVALGQQDAGFRQIIEALPAAIYITDAAGRITFYNEAAAAFWGRHPNLGEEQFCGSWKLRWPNGTPLAHRDCPMAVALRTGRRLRGVEAVAERADGKLIPFAAYPTPIFDASRGLMGAVNMLVDLSDRQRSEESARRLASIVQSSDDAIVSKDLRGIISSWNEGAERLFGYTEAEAIGKPVMIVIPADRAEEEESILARLRRGERIDHFETVRRRKDGSLLDVSLTVSPIHGADGRVIGASKIARDITERKRAHEQHQLLLGEIMHRVKNTLAIVQAIAAQTLRRAPAEERDAFTARLHALGKAHDLLTSDSWDRTPMRVVIGSALMPFQEQRFTLEGPEAYLNASGSLHMTLALHELATNAVTYGALSNATGRVHLNWRSEDGGLEVCWAETGGPVVGRPRRKGFGTLLIEHAFEGARFQYTRAGLLCTFKVSL
jgi:two-component system, chemotaxis family, CheB/CheR fusion protein